MPKNPKNPSGSGPDYYKKRRLQAVTMIVEDPEFKDRIQQVARKDRRSVNNWLTNYILPHIEHELNRQEGREGREGRKGQG